MKWLAKQVWLALMLATPAMGDEELSDKEFWQQLQLEDQLEFAAEEKRGEVRDNAFYERRSIRNIKAAADSVIEEGIPEYYQRGATKKGFTRYLAKKWRVRNAGMDMPFVETKGHLAKFRLATSDVKYLILNLYRETLAGGIYEFWIVRVGTDYGSLDTARCMFYVTRADDVRGHREILLKSDRFISRYEVTPGTYFDFPVDDLEVVSKMEAWRYPESYPDSDLKNLKVVKHWRTGRLTVERGDGEEWAYEEDMDGYLMWLAEVTYAYKQAIKAGETYSEAEWEELYDGLVRYINRSKWPIKEKDWKRYKRRFDKLERLDKTAAKDRFDAKERLNIEWEDKK